MVPEVKFCHVNDCFYNRANECHAHAITVGSDNPFCETFMKSSQTSDKHGQGEVGACHINQCAYNDSMYCHACSDIEVGWSMNEVQCLTFRKKE